MPPACPPCRTTWASTTGRPDPPGTCRRGADSMDVAEQERPSRPACDLPPSLADVTVIIPALDEETSLPRVLGDLPRVGRVIVVDNGSTDGTARVASEAGAMVVAEPRRGYGSACLRG